MIYRDSVVQVFLIKTCKVKSEAVLEFNRMLLGE